MQCFFSQFYWRYNLWRRTAPHHKASMGELASGISSSRVTRTACSPTFPAYTLFVTNVHMICTGNGLSPAKSTFKGVLSLHTVSISGWQRIARACKEACYLSSIWACLAGFPSHYPSSSAATMYMLKGLSMAITASVIFRAPVFRFRACFPADMSVHRIGLCPNHWPNLASSRSDFLSPVLFRDYPCVWATLFFFVFSFNIVFVIWKGWVGKDKKWRFDFWSELWSCICHSSGNLFLMLLVIKH